MKCLIEMSTSNSNCKSDTAEASSSIVKDDIKDELVEKAPSVSLSDAELDAASECFNPFRVLYEKDVRISKKPSRVEYQNVAAFESAFKRLGVWGLQQNKSLNKSGETKSQTTVVKDEKKIARRFEAHQMPVKASTRIGQRHYKNILNSMDKMEGPLRLISDSVKMQRRVRVLVRNERGICGHIEGKITCFDKHWNLLLNDVTEVWRRRKFKYGVNKTCEAGNPEVDCTQRLANLGITLPQQTVKSIDRKNVEITRRLDQLMIRGEQIVLINVLENKK